MVSSHKDIDEFFSKEPIENPREQATYEARYLRDMNRHIEKYIGDVDHVLHEVISYDVHIDVHVIKPSKKVPFLTIVTSGMSDKKMTLPQEGSANGHGYSEFIAFLPEDWPVSFSENDDKFWPEEILRANAKWCHESGSFYDWFHTISNDTPAAPYVEESEMSGVLITPPTVLPPDAWMVPTFDGKIIKLLNAVPIHFEEIEYGMKNGGERLFDELKATSCNFTFDPQRANILHKRKKLFGIF
jgi:hypothetical protein